MRQSAAGQRLCAPGQGRVQKWGGGGAPQQYKDRLQEEKGRTQQERGRIHQQR
jgi:hypothetical protein